MNDSAAMRIRIDAEVSSAVKGLQSVSKSLDAIVPGGKTVSQVLQRIQFGLLQIVQGTARNAFVSITAGMKGMVNAGMQVAETLEAAEVGFNSILAPGQDVKALLLDIQKNAIKTPFDVDDLTASTQKLALITKNGAQAEQTVLDLGAAVAAAGRGNAELNRMAINMQQIGLNSKATARDIREFGNAGVDIVGLVTEYSKAFKESGKQASEAMDWLKSISNPYEVIAEVLHKAADETGRFGKIYEEGATTIKQANENMQDSMAVFSYRVLEQSKILDKAKNIFSEFQNSLFLDETFTANTAAAIQHVIDMVNELDIIRPIIDGIKKAVSAFASGQFDNVIVFFKSLFNAIKQFSGIKVIANAFEVFLDLFSDNHSAQEVANVANQIGTLVRWFLELKFALSVTSYLANFMGVFMKLGYALTGMVPSIIKTVQGFSSLITAGGKWVVVAAAIVGAIVLIKKYGNEIGSVFGKIGKMVQSAAEAVANAVKQFVSIGYNIMAGLWNGIVEGAQAVFKGIQNIGRSIVNGFKSILGIHSPSRVMRDTIGRNIDLGIAEGISRNYGAIAKASEDVLNELVKLQQQYVTELGDFGALDLVQTVKVYKDFAQLYKEGTKARIEMNDKVHDSEMAIVKEMISLIETYNKQWDKAYTKAKDYYDMFEYTQNTLTRSTKSVIEGLKRQNDNLTKYYDNLLKMSTMGFDSDFMEYIYEQGLDAAVEVNGLAEATAEQIEEINKLWATRGKVASDIATLNTKKLKEETLEELDYLQEGLEVKVIDYYEDGAKLAYNFAEGIYAMMPTIEEAMMRVEANTKKKASDIGEVATDYADIVNGALGEIDTSAPVAELEKLEVKMFDTNDALSLFKNLLNGIPWYIWAAGAVILVLKLRDIWDSIRGITSETKAIDRLAQSFPKAAGGVGELKSQLSAISYHFTDLIEKLQQVLDKMEQLITTNSNYESTYRQAMNGIYAVTDETERQIIETLDFAKGQGIITTEEATRAMGDIMRNGFEGISSETLRTFSYIENELDTVMGVAEEDVTYAVAAMTKQFDGLIEQALRDSMNGAKTMATQAVEQAGISLAELKSRVVSETGEITGNITAVAKEMAYEMGDSWEEISRIGTQEFKILNKVAEETFQDMERDADATSIKIAESLDIIADGAGDSFDELGAELKEKFQAVADENNKIAKQTATQYNRMMKDITGENRAFSDDLKDDWRRVASQASDTGKKIETAFSAPIQHTLELTRDEAKGLSSAYRDIADSTDYVAGHVITSFGEMEQGSTRSMSKMASSVTGGFSSLVNKSSSGLLKLSSAMTGFGTMLGGISPKLSGMFTSAGDVLSNGISKLQSMGVGRFGEMAEKFKNSFSGLGKGMKTSFTDMKQVASDGLDQVKVTTDFKIDETAASATSKVKGMFGKVSSSITNFLSGLGSVLSAPIKGLGDIIVQLLDALGGIVKGAVKSLLQTIGGIINAFLQTLMTLLKTALGGIGDALAALLRPLSDPKLLIGVAAIGVLALALVGLAAACKTFSEVSWEDMAKAAVALVGIGVITGVMGAFAEVIIPGAIALAAASAAVLVAGVAIKVFAECIQQASIIAGQIDINGMAMLGAAILAVSAVMASTVGANILGAISALAGAVMGGALLLIATEFALASKMASQIDLIALGYIALACDTIGLLMAAGIVTNVLGAISGLAGVLMAGELLVIAVALEETSKHAKNIDLIALGYAATAVDIIGTMLTAGLVTSIIGALSGAFATLMSGELLVITLALEEASKHAGNINLVTLGYAAAAIDIIGGIFAVGLVGNIIGALSGGFATVISVEVLGIVAALAKATELAKDVNTDSMKKVQDVVNTLKDIDFGNFFSNMGKLGSAAELAGVAAAVAIMVENVIKIINNLDELDAIVDPSNLNDKMDRVKEIVTKVNEFCDGDWIKSIGQKNQSNNLAQVAENVSSTIENVKKILENFQDIEKLLNGKSFVDDYSQAIKDILDAVSKLMDDIDAGGWGNNKAGAATKLSEIADGVSNTLEKVVSICENLEKAEKMMPDNTSVAQRVGSVHSIIEEVAKLVDGVNMGGWGNKKDETAKKMADMADGVDKILDHLVKIFKNMDGLKDLGVTAETVNQKIGEVNKILNELAKINLDGDGGVMDQVKEKAAKISEYAGSFDTIITTVAKIVNTVNELSAAGNTPEKVKQIISNVEGIINELAKINVNGKEEDLASTATKAGSLKTAADNYDNIITSVRNIVDKLSKFLSDGYNFNQGGNKDVVVLISTLNSIIAELGKVAIGGTIASLTQLSEKSTKLKDAAKNLNEIVGSVTEMVDKLDAFDKAYGNRTVGEIIKKLNTQIIAPIVGGVGADGTQYEGIVVGDMPEGIVEKLETVNQAVQKIGLISQSLLSVQDATNAIVNVSGIVQFIKDTMTALPPALATFANDMEIQGQNYADSFLNGWRSKFGEAESVAGEMQGKMWSVLEGKMQDEYWQGAALGGKVIDGLREKTPEFETVANEHQKKYWNAVESKMNDARAQGQKLGQKVLEGLQSVTDSFTQAGKEVQGAFWNAIEGKMQDEYWQGAALAGKLVDGVKSKNGEYEGIGENIVKGVATGITNNMWRINSAAGQISSTAVDKLKSLLDIHSPSRVMAELGSYVAEGFAEGITDGLQEVENAGEKLAEAIMDGYNDTMEPLAISAFEARTAAMDAQGGYGTNAQGQGNTTNITQNNNIYNNADTSKALADIAWAVSRS